MLPVIAIIGRPNVGKSTLFNVLTQSRQALVADMPGVTRDRQYGEGKVGDHAYWVVDTGGWLESKNDEMAFLTNQQVQQAILEADHVLWMLDAKTGLMSEDYKVAQLLRPQSNKVTLVINKADHEEENAVASEFYSLGFGQPQVVSALRKRGIQTLVQAVFSRLPTALATEEPIEKSDRIRVMLMGRPNVGKSTLINRLLGEERVIVFDEPGTTRDSIYIPFDYRDQQYLLIDTAGVRRRGKVHEMLEKFSIIKTLQALEMAHVVIVVLNAREGISDQDLRLVGMVLRAGKGIVIAINQWDNLPDEEREQVKSEIDRRLPFLDFARRYTISALHGTGVGKLYGAIQEAYQSATREISTGELTKAMETATLVHQPPLVQGRRIKLRYAHLGGRHPLTIVIHGKQVDKLPGSYQRYLSSYFRKTFDLVGIPIQLKFNTDDNPYVD